MLNYNLSVYLNFTNLDYLIFTNLEELIINGLFTKFDKSFNKLINLKKLEIPLNYDISVGNSLDNLQKIRELSYNGNIDEIKHILLTLKDLNYIITYRKTYEDIDIINDFINQHNLSVIIINYDD